MKDKEVEKQEKDVYEEIIRYLIENGADPEVVNFEGKKPFDYKKDNDQS